VIDSFSPLTATPQRILLAGDWHGNTAHAQWVMRHAARTGCAGVLQLGDFGIWPGEGGRRYLQALSKVAAETGVWVAFIDGNHEDFWQLNSLPVNENGVRKVAGGIWHLPRGLRWQWAGRTWLAMGGATSLDRAHRRLGSSWWPEESITDAQFREVTDGGRADVMLTHDCPDTVPIPGLDPRGWSPEALEIAEAHRKIVRAIAEVVQPHELWHGHFHIRYRAEVSFADTPCVVNGLGDDGDGLRNSVALLDITT
jgi:hypothetical protein